MGTLPTVSDNERLKGRYQYPQPDTFSGFPESGRLIAPACDRNAGTVIPAS
jgi:hypothetical protein